jgi:hypothetical protein
MNLFSPGDAELLLEKNSAASLSWEESLSQEGCGSSSLSEEKLVLIS